MKRKLTKIQVQQLNSTAEIDNNTKINDFMGLTTAMNFDIYKEGSYIIEAKLDIRDSSNGLKKASQELNKYKEKLMFLGMKLPKLRLILDYETKKLYLPNGDVYCKLEEFDFNLPEDYENYDITFDNGDNVAQQIYSRHPKINDSNIFDYFQTGIDWYNPTKLNQQDFRLKLDLFNDPLTFPTGIISIGEEFLEGCTSLTSTITLRFIAGCSNVFYIEERYSFSVPDQWYDEDTEQYFASTAYSQGMDILVQTQADKDFLAEVFPNVSHTTDPNHCRNLIIRLV